MVLARNVMKSLKIKDSLQVNGTILGSGMSNVPGDVWYVDGNRSTTGAGTTWGGAFLTIQEAVTAAGAGDVIYIAPIEGTDLTGDPGSYAENIIIPVAARGLSLIGIGTGRVQGGLPQIKIGGVARSYLITIRAPGCLITNLGFNGISTAGAAINGAILLDDDYATKSAFGTTITNCHFKNCTGATVTDGRTGGAIDWSSTGNAWQVYIGGNKFYKNVADIVLLGTSSTVPQDVVIENNIFSGPTANVDSQLYLAGGSGMNGVTVKDNLFPCIGTLSSAVAKRMADLTGCVGNFSGNMFGTSTTLTMGATGSGAKIPTTVLMTANYRETTTGVNGEVFRT